MDKKCVKTERKLIIIIMIIIIIITTTTTIIIIITILKKKGAKIKPTKTFGCNTYLSVQLMW